MARTTKRVDLTAAERAALDDAVPSMEVRTGPAALLLGRPGALVGVAYDHLHVAEGFAKSADDPDGALALVNVGWALVYGMAAIAAAAGEP